VPIEAGEFHLPQDRVALFVRIRSSIRLANLCASANMDAGDFVLLGWRDDPPLTFAKRTAYAG
jgi:hypothetical protein